ncbi:carbohydrate binding family 9 domain-containing protein [Planctomycetota bacterium]
MATLAILFIALEMSSASGELAKNPLPGSERSLQVPFIESPWVDVNGMTIVAAPPPLIVVDGHLNDALWTLAVVSGDFWSSLENTPPTDQTIVLVASDNSYLYIGCLLYDSKPEKIQATQTVRDVGFGYDDVITIELDTFFNRRDISTFSINPLGTQTGHIAGGRSSKIEWKGDWLGSTARTDYGWSAEFAIPFAILNYQPDNTVFGVNFKRYQSRTKAYSWWADVTPKMLPEEMGQLQGLTLPSISTSNKKPWTFMPYVLGGKNIADKKGEIQDTLVTGGIDIRYQPRSDSTGMLSLNPDFSQVEDAVTDISFSYSEKAVADNRPFFAEGAGYFADEDDDNEYFYSNRVADFDYGGKGFGRTSKTKWGVLATSAPEDRFDFAGRALYELNDTHSATATLTATDQMAFNNALAVGQFGGRQASGLNYSLDAAATDTSEVRQSNIPYGQGTHFKGGLGWNWDYWYVNGSADQYDAEYFPALGLLNEDLPGTRGVSTTGGYYRERSDSPFRVINGYVGFKHRNTTSDLLQSRKLYTGASVEFEKPIRASIYLDEGPYRKAVNNPGDFEETVNQDRYYSASLDFNTRSSIYSFGALYGWGQLGGGEYEYVSAYAWWRPINEVHLSVSNEHTYSFGYFNQTVLVGSWNITPEDSLAARYIITGGDYSDSDEGSLRVAYGRKARKGLDIFMVYNKEPLNDAEYSIKLVLTF